MKLCQCTLCSLHALCCGCYMPHSHNEAPPFQKTASCEMAYQNPATASNRHHGSTSHIAHVSHADLTPSRRACAGNTFRPSHSVTGRYTL